MIHDAGAECVKFQCHIIEDEMIKNNIVPKNANKSIWEIMKKCSFITLSHILN
jgi:sialic acid synthase SpsE